jgi:thiamine-phosphate pyrophosphorylase
MSKPSCRLYLVCPSPLPDGFDAVLDRALNAGDVAALRVANSADAQRLRPVAHRHGVAVILAGRPDLAAPSGCDGAHLDDGAPVAAARRVLGDLQLGVSCDGSRDKAMQAGQDGADYVAFGPFFGPEDLDHDEDGADPELLSWWVELMELPAVAEGGITLDNCGALVRAGADFLAVGDEVWHHAEGPAAAVRAFNEAIAAHAPDV